MRILVPLDGSPESAAALATLAAWSTSCRPDVAVLYVSEPHTAEEDLADVRKICEDPRLASLHVRRLEARGRPARAILEAADRERVDLIAMTTHGRTGVRRLMLGSVTEDVLRRADVPVLACRPDSALPPEGRILVPLDGSRTAEGILPDAVRAARLLHTTIEIAHVVPPPILPAQTGFRPPPRDPLPYLTAICEDVESRGVEATPLVLEGRPTEAVLEHARETRTRLIAAGTYGRWGLTRWITGSVAEEIVRESPCPVLVRCTEKHATRSPRRHRLDPRRSS